MSIATGMETATSADGKRMFAGPDGASGWSIGRDCVPEGADHAAKREDGAIFHLVTFHMLLEEYGVDIGSVQEIIRASDITPVPGAPFHVRGVINLRGKVVPVVDLRKRFGLPVADVSDAHRIVVVELGEKLVGMLVDRVSQVIKVPAGMVEEIPEEATSPKENYIMGVGKIDSRLIIVLDLNRSLLLS